jgi:hypothetical protein
MLHTARQPYFKKIDRKISGGTLLHFFQNLGLLLAALKILVYVWKKYLASILNLCA